MLPDEPLCQLETGRPGSDVSILALLEALPSFLCPSPGIRYVVDAGRSKQKLLEGDGSLARYEVSVDICTAQAPATATLHLGESNSS